jgi:hypothetical protein
MQGGSKNIIARDHNITNKESYRKESAIGSLRRNNGILYNFLYRPTSKREAAATKILAD